MLDFLTQLQCKWEISGKALGGNEQMTENYTELTPYSFVEMYLLSKNTFSDDWTGFLVLHMSNTLLEGSCPA